MNSSLEVAYVTGVPFFFRRATSSSSFTSISAFHPCLPLPPSHGDRSSFPPPAVSFARRRLRTSSSSRPRTYSRVSPLVSIDLSNRISRSLSLSTSRSSQRDLLKDLCLTTECAMNYINFAFSATLMYRSELIIAGVLDRIYSVT